MFVEDSPVSDIPRPQKDLAVQPSLKLDTERLRHTLKRDVRK